MIGEICSKISASADIHIKMELNRLYEIKRTLLVVGEEKFTWGDDGFGGEIW